MACIELEANWDRSHRSATDLTRLVGGGKEWLVDDGDDDVVPDDDDNDATVRTAATAVSEESVQWTSAF
jgi:hypothetical protein